MSYTFEEAMAWWLAQQTPAGSVLVADVTIVRTQDDGRTGFMSGFFGSLNQSPQEGDSFRGGGLEQFSDRTRENIPYELNSDKGSIYTQNFDNRHQDGANQVDRVDVIFLKRFPDDFFVEFTYPRWGARGGVAVSRAEGTKLYVGFGTPIGNSLSPAIYTLAIQSVYMAPY